jgi:hypothetical protein
MAQSDDPTCKPETKETEDKQEDRTGESVGHISKGKPVGLLQVNCSSVCNKTFEFWNLINTCNSDVIGTESWFSEEINNAEVVTDYITFSRNRCSQGGGVFISVKNYIECTEL